MAGSNTSTTSYALEKSFRGRFLSTFAYLAGRDLSLSTTLFKRFVDPVSPYEALSSWSFLVIAVFWLWMLASRLGMLAVIILVATAPWWLALFPKDTTAVLAAALKATARLLVGEAELEALLVQQAVRISDAENAAFATSLHEAKPRADEVPSSCSCERAAQLQDDQTEMKSMALLLTKKTEELATIEHELGETKAELEEHRLIAQDARRVPALVATIEGLHSELEAAKELLVDKEREVQDGERQVCEKERELGELVDELEALRNSENRARAGAAATAKTMVELRADLTVAKTGVASLTNQLSEQKDLVASITAQLAEQEAETALANQEIEELREQVDQGQQALKGIVDEANEKIHRRNAEVSRLWAFVQVRLAEVDGIRWELGVCQDGAGQSKKAMEVFQSPLEPSAAASDTEEAEPASNLPEIVVQSPSSESVREEKTKADKSLLRAPKRSSRTKSRLPKKKSRNSMRAQSIPNSPSFPSPSRSSSHDAPPRPSSPLPWTKDITSSPSLATHTLHATIPSTTTIAGPADNDTISQSLFGDETTPMPSSMDDEPLVISSLGHEATMLSSFSHIDDIIPPVTNEPINSHISALKADSKAFWAPARTLTASLRLRRNPLGSISGNAPRRSRFRNQNRNQNQTTGKPAHITHEVDEGSWTVVSFD